MEAAGCSSEEQRLVQHSVVMSHPLRSHTVDMTGIEHKNHVLAGDLVLAAGTECSGTFHLWFEAETHTEDHLSYGDVVSLDMVGLDS